MMRVGPKAEVGVSVRGTNAPCEMTYLLMNLLSQGISGRW